MSFKSYDDMDDLVADSIIDSRDLAAALDDYDDEVSEGGCNCDDPTERERIREEYGELAEEIRNASEDVADWPHGATLIREDKFEDYARELAEDVGAISDDASWPATCIDWEKAASELAMDYSSVELGGNTFYVR